MDAVKTASDINTIIMTTGGWGLASIMLIVLVCYHRSMTAILNMRHEEMIVNLINATAALTNSTAAITAMEKSIDILKAEVKEIKK